jgi:dTMP kinase
MMKEVHSSILDALIPDITFFLRVDVNKGFERLAVRCKEQAVEPDRMESQQRDFYERVFTGYEELANQEKRIHRIDGSSPIEEIADHIQEIVSALLSDKKT